MWMPYELFPRAVVPSAAVPMRLPFTTLPVEPLSLMAMPAELLPEMTLRAAAAAPPMVLLEAPAAMRTPSLLFPRSAVPLTSVPMKLPSTSVEAALAEAMWTPKLSLPEMTLPAPAAVPAPTGRG